MRRMSVLFAPSVALILPATPAEDGADLFRAIRNGDVAFIKAHLRKPEIEVRDGRRATPLVHAAAFGNLETLKLLLEAGADVNARNDFDSTALLWAARDPDKAGCCGLDRTDLDWREFIFDPPPNSQSGAVRQNGAAP